MRSILLFACLCGFGAVSGQGSGFTFTYTGPTQIIVGTNCLAPLNWGAPGTPTVTSNLPGGMIVSFNIYSISGGYDPGDLVMGGTTVTVFYQAIDNFGNSALFGFSIVFIDLTPPVFDPTTLPPNITISCISNLPPPALVEASDNCADEDPPLTITYTQTINAALCTGGTIKRKWVADDDLGNTSMFMQTITVLPDNTPPVIANTLQNGMAPCSTAMAQYTTWLNTQRANFSATDNGCGVMSLTDNAPSPATITSFCGQVPVTFTAKDNCNNTSTVVKTFTIFNNIPPVIVNPASGASGNCSQPNIAQVFNNWIATHGGATATDDCSSIFWSTFPPSPSIADTCNAAIEVLFIAGDGCNNFDTTKASFVLLDDTPPSITAQPSTMVLSCTTPSLDSILMDWLVTGGNSAAHDLCTPDAQLELGYRINGNELSLPEVLEAWQDSLNAGCKDGVIINGIGINNVKALLKLDFTYDDQCDNEAAVTGFFGITDNGKPVFDTLPSNLSYSCSTSQSWMDAFDDWYTTAGHADYHDQCSDVIVNASITADSAITYLSAALDTGCMQGVSVSIQFSLQDECGNVSTISPSATFSLGDTLAPVFLTPASNLTLNCSTAAQAQFQAWLDTHGGATATDGCSTLEWSFSWIDTAGMTQTGISGSGPYPQASSLGCNSIIAITFTVSDLCQNAASITADFMIIDTISPVITVENDTILLGCKDMVPVIIPLVADECDPNPSVTFQDSVSLDTCLGHPAFILLTITATDACGNSATAQVWMLSADTIPPTFDLPTDTVAFCSIDTLSLLNVSDDCDPDPVVTYIDALSGPACAQTLIRTWVVTDACGNSSTALQMFDLSDNGAPFIQYSPGDYVFSCDTATGSLQSVYAQWKDSVIIDDACSSADWFIALPGSYVLEDTATWPGTPLPDSIMLQCGLSMTIDGDLVAFDACGNVLVESISFTVDDTVGPVFTDCPPTLYVSPNDSCSAKVTLAVPAYEEVCFPDDVEIQLILDGGDTIAFDSLISLDTLLGVGFHTVRWIASDCNGNTGTCETSIAIIDEEAISVFCPADTFLFTEVGSCSSGMYIQAPVTTVAGCGTGASSWSGYIDGSADPNSFQFTSGTDSVFVLFDAGSHLVYLVARDSTGDIDTCHFSVDVRDTFPPGIVCQTDTLYLATSGLDTVLLNTTHLLVSSTDACGIDTVVYDPDRVTCSSNGQALEVTITVTDINGNSGTCTASLLVLTRPLEPSWERGLCDDTLRLYSNVAPDSLAGYTYAWNGPNGFVSTEANPVIPDSDSTYSGTYILILQSANGCISTGAVDILIQELVSPLIISVEDTLCDGSEITLVSQAFSGEVSYQWYQVLGFGDVLLGETSEPQFSWIAPGPSTYSFYAIVVSDTCMSAPGPAIDVLVAPVPEAIIADIPSVLCITDSLILAPSIVFDSLTYSWTGSGGYASNEPMPPPIAASSIDSMATYFLTVSTVLCTSLPDSAQVAVQLPPVTPTLVGDAQACEGGSIQLIASPAAENYTWIDPAGQLYATDSDTLRIEPIALNQSGDWRVISYLQGCPSDTSAPFSIQVDTAIEIAIVTTERVCAGDSILLTIEPGGTGTYSWSGPGGFSSNETSPRVLAQEGIYQVTLLTTTGCEASDEVAITVDQLPMITGLSTDADTCVDGTGTIQIWSASDPPFQVGFGYQWTGPGSFTVEDSSIVIGQATAAASGTYTLSILNGTCRSDTASIDLFLQDQPLKPEISGTNVYCFGDTIRLLIDNPVAEGTYTWSSNDTILSVPSPGTLLLPGAGIAQTGIYHVFVTVNGCASEQALYALQVKPPLSPAVITGTSFVCEGDSIHLSPGLIPNASYHWFGPNGFETTDTEVIIYPATPDDAGAYAVSYELNGCISAPSVPFSVSIQPSVTMPLINADVTSICIDAPIPVNICLEPSTLTPGGTYAWILNGSMLFGSPTPDSCMVFDGAPLQVGDNLVSVVTQYQGCTSDTSNLITIIGTQFPAVMADAGMPEVFCPGETLQLNGSDPAPGNGVWTTTDPLVIFGDETNPVTTLLPLPPGQYTFHWTLSYDICFNYSSDSVTITLINPPMAWPDTVEVPFGQTIQFNVLPNDSLFAYPYTIRTGTAPQKGNVLHIGNGEFRYSPNVGFVGTDVMTYVVCSADCPEECSETTVILNVGNESDCFIPSLFTPNDDGINDVLIVPCLESTQFPSNKIIIFNEWGDAVYTASPYFNDWDGRLSGEPLPAGTYFYILDFGDGTKPKRSFLILER